MFSLPHSLDLQIAPTAVRRLGGQAVYTTHRPAVTRAGMWYRYVTDLGNCHGWTCTS